MEPETRHQMTQTLVFSKSEEGLSTEKVQDIFENTDDIEKIKETVKKAEDRIFVSWDTVEKVDNDNEIIPVDDKLIKHYEIYVEERSGPLSDLHSNRIIGKTLSFKVLEHPGEKENAILSLNKIHKHNPVDDKVWEKVKTGEYQGVSLGGYAPVDKMESREDGLAKVLDVQGIHEKSTVDTPANSSAVISAASMIAKMDDGKTRETVEQLQEKLADTELTKSEHELVQGILGEICKQEKHELDNKCCNKCAETHKSYKQPQENKGMPDPDVIEAVAENYNVSPEEAKNVLSQLHESEKKEDEEPEEDEVDEDGNGDEKEENDVMKNIDEKIEKAVENGIAKAVEGEADESAAGVNDPVEGEPEVGDGPAEAKGPETPSETQEEGDPEDDAETDDEEVQTVEKKVGDAVEKKLSELGVTDNVSTPRPMQKNGRDRGFNQGEDNDYPAAVDPYETFIKSMHDGEKVSNQEMHKINNVMQKDQEGNMKKALGGNV